MLHSFSPVSTGTVFLLWHSIPPLFYWNWPSPIQFASLCWNVTSSETVLTRKPKIDSLPAPCFFLRASYYFPLKTFTICNYILCVLIYPPLYKQRLFLIWSLYKHVYHIEGLHNKILNKWRNKWKKSKLKGYITFVQSSKPWTEPKFPFFSSSIWAIVSYFS